MQEVDCHYSFRIPDGPSTSSVVPSLFGVRVPKEALISCPIILIDVSGMGVKKSVMVSLKSSQSSTFHGW